MGFFDLTGQTAIVTGAATGIGEAVARRLARAGSNVAVADLDQAGAARVAAEIGAETGREVFAVEVDISSATSVSQAVAAVLERMGRIEEEFGQLKKTLADLEILTFQHGKINPHSFGVDEVDHKIMEYLLHYKSGTTPELAEYVKTNRWLILNRLQRIQKNSKKQLGKSIIEYYAGERSGKKKAWWIDEELIQE